MKSFGPHWKRLPNRIRKPLVLVLGVTLVIMSGLLGWLPGPGGIPMFLAGVAILASEFSWAERFRDFILFYIKLASKWYKRNFALGNALIGLASTVSIIVLYLLYFK